MNNRGFLEPLLRTFFVAVLGGVCIASEATQGTQKEQFLASVRAALPPHSSLPPVTDLAVALAPAALANHAWEDKYQNMEGMIRRDVTDLPENAGDVGGLATTTKEVSGGSALPARDASVVVIATVLSGSSHVASNKHLVYSDYQLSVKKRLKGSSSDLGSRQSHINILVFGGGVRFPSGYTEYFVIHGIGFLEEGRDYLLFLWKSTKGTPAFDVLGAYLLHDQEVQPIVVGQRGAYAGTALSKFELAVKSAIRANVNR